MVTAIDRITRVVSSGTSSTATNFLINIKDPPYSAVGDGVADDTVAFQAALDLFAFDGTLLGGRIYVPAGSYNITGLTYEGDFGHSFVMMGATEGEAATTDGPVLKYTGSAGGTLLTLKGANKCRFEDLQFYGNGLALYCVDVQYDVARSMSSFDCTWRHCGFGGAVGTDSMAMRWGQSTGASAEHTAVNCRFISHSTPGTTYYGIGTSGSANTKNHTIERCRFIAFRWGIGFSNSGYHKVDSCSFASQTVADIKASNDQITVINSGSEGSAKFIDDAGGNVSGQLLMQGCYWAGITVGDDFVIDYDGQLTMIANSLSNGRSPTLKTFTVDTGTDVITSTAHGFPLNGLRVNVSSTGTLPAPLVAQTNYYLRDVTTNTFKLALTAGGTAIDLTSAGSGTHSVYRPVEPAVKSGVTVTSGAVRGSVVSFNNTFLRASGSPVMDFIPVYDSGGQPVATFLAGEAADGYSGPSNMRGLQVMTFGDKSRQVDSDVDVNFPPRMTMHSTYLMAISTTATPGKNLRGSVTFSTSDTATVTFNAAEPDANYFIAISGNAAEVFWATTKTTSGFTMRSSNPASVAAVDWLLVR